MLGKLAFERGVVLPGRYSRRDRPLDGPPQPDAQLGACKRYLHAIAAIAGTRFTLPATSLVVAARQRQRAGNGERRQVLSEVKR